MILISLSVEKVPDPSLHKSTHLYCNLTNLLMRTPWTSSSQALEPHIFTSWPELPPFLTVAGKELKWDISVEKCCQGSWSRHLVYAVITSKTVGQIYFLKFNFSEKDYTVQVHEWVQCHDKNSILRFAWYWVCTVSIKSYPNHNNNYCSILGLSLFAG